jgi:hypothetical protein
MAAKSLALPELRAAPTPLLLCVHPAVLKWVMAVFDVPEAIAVSRTAMCNGETVTRLQAAGYYLGILAFYWCVPGGGRGRAGLRQAAG